MKKVLIVANLLHASPRMPNLTPFLQENGWQATILTPPLTKEARNQLGLGEKFTENVKLCEASYPGDALRHWRKLLYFFGFKRGSSLTEQIKGTLHAHGERSVVNRLLYFYQSLCAFPDTEKTWIKPALKMGRELLKKEGFDAIMSSSPYPSSHVVAEKLAGEFSVPWVCEFRDAWSLNHNYPFGSVRKKIDMVYERKLLRAAHSIVIAAPGLRRMVLAPPQLKMTVVTNGFNLDVMKESTLHPPRDRFVITYTGNIYAGKQNPHVFFRAIKTLSETHPLVREGKFGIHFFGKPHGWVEDAAHEAGVEDLVLFKGLIPHDEVRLEQQQSHLLLNLGWNDESFKGCYSIKFFEYLGARRPILIAGGPPDEELKMLAEELQVGFGASREEDIIAKLTPLLDEFTQKGSVAYQGIDEKVDHYSWRNLAKKLCGVLEETQQKG
ncbi:hypothetical protein CO046_01070 [Candidatus Peregrinibacteria bacterium CG_4_9_14_0_2_um_filter_53_11]|nr:MAG: hypothetical protein CO046_01070 [Candidatus Peregrinibacteria bacterium CG_4_9_14_0_2_um_filter_53_11]